VPGVTDVNSFGGQVKQYQVLLDPGKLKSLNLTIRDVTEAIEKNNATVGAGYIEHREEQLMVRGIGQARNVDDLKDIVVKSPGGTPIHLHDVGEVVIGNEPRQGATTYNGKGEVVAGIVMMLKGASSREVVDSVTAKIKTIERRCLKG